MSTRSVFGLIAAGLFVATASLASFAQWGVPPGALPGPLGAGVTLLPNGWRIAPAGKHMAIGDLPLNMVLSPDGRSLIVANNGYAKPTLRVVDLERMYVTSGPAARRCVARAGVASGRDAALLVGRGVEQRRRAGVAERAARAPRDDLAGAAARGADGGHESSEADAAEFHRRRRGESGRQVARRRARPRASRLARRHGDRASCARRPTLPAEPYTALFSRDGATVFVSLWGGAKVLRLDPKTLRDARRDRRRRASERDGRVGGRPAVRRVREHERRVGRSIARRTSRPSRSRSRCFPNAPPGSTPNAVALSPDGQRLAVANADNNTVALVDMSNRRARAECQGIHSDRLVSDRRAVQPRRRRALRAERQGSVVAAESARRAARHPGRARASTSGSMLQGSLSIVPMPDDATLQRYTKTVYGMTPYSDATRLAPASAPAQSPIPRASAQPSPIKHVFYVIRENRTYDQILGDLETGNGDPTLALFGEDITPNAHALAREFVTLDNFYVDAEVSYDGHAFSTGAYRDRLRRENLADELRQPRRGLPQRRRRQDAERVRQHRGAAATATSGTPPSRRARPCAATASSRDTRRQDRRRSVAVRARPRGPRASVVPAVGPEDSGQQAHRRLARGVPAVRGERSAAGAVDPAPGQRPHQRHARRLTDAARDDRRERPRARTPRRRDQPQQVLERVGDLRARRRRAERAGSRGRAPIGRVRRESRTSRRGVGRQHALHDVGHAAHDGADPRPRADEPVRRGRDADVSRVHE